MPIRFFIIGIFSLIKMNIRIERLACILFILVFTTSITSQYRSLRFENITIDNGLSNNSINCILQTSDGFLWIATKDGLNRYDGQNFKIYKNNPAIKKSLPENYVMCLLESKDGTFWVGTWGGGLYKFDPYYEDFIRYDKQNDNNDDYIECMIEDNLNNIWFGTMHSGVNKLNPATREIISYNKNQTGKYFFPDNEVTSIVQVNNRYLWIGTLTSGLIKFDPVTETFKQFKHNPADASSVSSNYVWDVFNDGDKCLYLSTENGLDKLDLVSETISHPLHIPIQLNINSLATFRQAIKDQYGNIWAGTYNYNGLFLFPDSNVSDKNFIYLQRDDNDQNSIISNRIRWLYEDKSCNMWIGTEEGISKLPNAKPFIQYRYNASSRNGIGGKVVSSIIGSDKNKVWVGYGGGGFDEIDLVNNTFTHYKSLPDNSNSLSVDDVVCLYQDKYSVLWIGTSYGGLNKFDPITKKFKRYQHNSDFNQGIKSDWVQQILETSSGFFLIGTNDGLQIFDRKTETFSDFNPENLNTKQSLPANLSINSLFEDSKGTIWIGTWLSGLYCYNPESKWLDHYMPVTGEVKSISSSKITSIYEDSKKNIWISTHSGGINKFNHAAKNFTRYSTLDGLPNDVVFGILEDKAGDLWLSTMKGLSRFNPASKTFRNYDQSDGIIHNQFNWHASYKDSNGRLYFGGNNGFIVFNPDEIKIDSSKLPIAFTSFKVFDKEATLPQSLPATKEIILNYDQNFFSIDFAALDLAPPHKHKYLYKLEGIDPDWILSENRTTAYYTDIEYGKYKFLVKASNADNVWSGPVYLTIIIKPAWWMTWWFKVIIVIAIIFLGYLIYRYRLNQLLKIERIRYNIASDLHDEIGSNLSSISVDAQVLKKSPSLSEKEYELTSDISKTATQTLDAMRDIIWFINPKHDEGEDILYKMKETAQRLLAGIEWSFNASDNVRFDIFTLEQRRNIFLIYKEALTNVTRHSNAGKCEINIDALSDKFIISVTDNGVGFDINTVQKHTGILSMQKRAQKINGTIKFERNASGGMLVSLILETKTNLKSKLSK